MSNSVVNRNVNIYINDAEAEKAMKNLQAQSDKLTEKIRKGEAAGKDMTASIARLEGVKGKMETLQQVMDGKIRPSFKMMTAEVQRLHRELKQMSEDQPGYAQKFAEYGKAVKVLDEMKEKVGNAKSAIATFGEQVKSIFVGTLFSNMFQSFLQGIGSYISGIIDGNAKLSDSLADIEKATNLSSEGAIKLNKSLGKIDTRTSTENLRQIAIGLGQVGEAATAANVAAIDKIVVALGDEFGGGAKEITTSLSVLRNNLDDIKSADYGGDIMHLGNAMNVLGASGLATAPVITDVTNRVAGTARTFGVSSGQILGLAATFQELGIETERGSTAYIRILQKIASQPKMFAEVIKSAKMDVGEFYKLVNTDINSAFLKVAEASKKAGDSNAAFGKILNDLGTDGAGVSELLSKVSANQKMVEEKTKLATEALKNNSSILSEFDKKNNTLAANLEKLGKNIAGWFSNSAFSTTINNMAKGLVTLTSKSKDLNDKFEEQVNKTYSLITSTDPLIKRYDELSSKAKDLGGMYKLTNDEQKEFKQLINDIVAIVPNASDAWDNLGNVIGVSTQRVREMIQAQKDNLLYTNRELITKTKADIKDLEKQVKAAEDKREQIAKFIDEGKKTGRYGTTKDIFGNEHYYDYNKNAQKDLDERYRKNEAQLAELNSLLNGAKERLTDLNGDAIQKKIDEAKKNAEAAKKKQEEDAEKAKKAGGKIADPEALKKAQDEAKKLAEELDKVREEMDKIAIEMKIDGLPAYEKDLGKINQRYDELKKKLTAAKASKEDFAKAEELRNREIEALNQRYYNKLITFFQEQDKTRAEASMNAHNKEINELNNLYAEQQLLMRNNSETILKLHYKRLVQMREIDKKFAREEMQTVDDVTDDLIKKPRKPSINAKNTLGGKDKGKGKKGKNENDDNNRLKEYIQLAEKATQLTNALFDIQRNADEYEIQRSRKVTDKKIAMYQQELDQKVISRQEYDAKVQEAQEAQEKKEAEIKKKQFEREKALSLVQATISGAQAVMTTLKDFGPPIFPNIEGIAAMALTIGTTVAQLAAIATQKAPEFARGGFIPQGNSHAQDGIKLVETRTGKIRGEIEGGEPIFSRTFYRNNKMMIDGMMAYSQQTGGAALNWSSAPVATINPRRISSQISTARKYATGGYLPGQAGSTQGYDVALMQKMIQHLDALNEKVNRPMKAYTLLSDQEKAAKRMSDIRASGTIR